MICEQVNDEYIRNNPIWLVNLTDGRTIYQKDEDNNSWLHLKSYLRGREVFISDMFLRFRDHWELVGRGCQGYFFVKSIIGNFIGYNQHMYKTGRLEDDGKVYTTEWIIPELMSHLEETRKPDEEIIRECLIQK